MIHYIILVIFAFFPSLIWLIFYLRKDVHPESKGMVFKIFFYGMAVALLAGLIESIIYFFSLKLNFSLTYIAIFDIFIGVALIEELLKYLVVKWKVLNNPEFDEPTDAMIYMIISALGFAALENILVLIPLGSIFLIKKVLMLTIVRFIGATFLHALCSGTVGYFLALSLYKPEQRKKLIVTGLIIAILLHGFYNFFIIETEEVIGVVKVISILAPIIILISLALFVLSGFKKLKKMKSVCKIT